MPDCNSPETMPNAADRLAHAEGELQSLRQELEHTHRLATLGVIAAGIAHEINNILTPVLAYAQLASSHPGDSQLQAKAVQKAIAGVQAAAQIVQAMLGFASSAPQSTCAGIRASIEAALDCIGRDPSKDRIQVNISADSAAAVRIRPLALQQVLMNLILNACAALRPRGGKITISAREDSTGITIIQVSDTGPGIPTEIVGRLFQPFVSTSRLDGHQTASDAQQRGTGLGLAICRRLIEEASGTITVSCPRDHGTTFTISLPTARAQLAKAS